MDSTNPVYDSVTSGALRMARRHWYVIALAAALGLVVGLYLTSGKATYRAEGTLQIMLDAVTPNTTPGDGYRPTIDPIALASRVEQSTGDSDIPDSTSFTVTGDSTGGYLTLTAAGDTEASAGEAFNTVATEATTIATDEVTESVRTRVAALEQLSGDAQKRVDQLDAQLEDLSAKGVTPAASNPVVIQRMAAADTLASVNLDLAVAQSQLETLSTRLVSVDDPTVSLADSGFIMAVALLVLGALVAFGVLLVIQAVDGRLRRRIQIERDVPQTMMLGVVARKAQSAQLSVLGRTLTRFISEVGVSRVLLVPIRGEVPPELASTLEGSQDIPVETADLETASGDYGDDSVGIVFLVPFGAVPQEELQGAVADARTAGSTKLATVLIRVPAADHAWAAVSTV